MKLGFILVVVFCIIACTFVAAQDDSPMKVSGNNIGNIVNLNVDASAVVSSNVEANIVQVLAAYLRQQAAIVGDLPNLPGVAAETAEETV